MRLEKQNFHRKLGNPWSVSCDSISHKKFYLPANTKKKTASCDLNVCPFWEEGSDAKHPPQFRFDLGQGFVKFLFGLDDDRVGLRAGQGDHLITFRTDGLQPCRDAPLR